MYSARSYRYVLTRSAAVGLALLLITIPLGAFAASPPPPPHPSQPAPTLQQIFKQASPAVVLIMQYDAHGKPTSLGSGFVISSNGVIVTNNHVISPDEGAASIAVKLPRGDVYTDVRIIYTEPRRDFAVLLIKATGLAALKVGDSDAVEVGDQVVAIGNPEGLELTFTSGIVEAVRLDPSTGSRFIQHQAPISHGSSGGPLLNMRGDVIGINTFAVKDAQNLNGAVPINYVKPYFGDAASMTWQQYAHVAPPAPAPQPVPAAPVSPTTPPNPSPTPSRPAPSQAGGPGTYFMGAKDYRESSENFKDGFASGVYDTISMFAAAAKTSGTISNSTTLSLFRCLDTQAGKLGLLREWIDSTVRTASGDSPAVSAVAKGCRLSFPGSQSYWTSVSDYPGSTQDFRLGFAAGISDAVSLLAAVSQKAGGINNQGLATLFGCLDSRGDKLGQFVTWMNTATAGASPNNPAIEVIAGVCLP